MNGCNSALSIIGEIQTIDKPKVAFELERDGASASSDDEEDALGCAAEEVTFTNRSENVVPSNNYQWSMGNGNTYSKTVTPPAQDYTLGRQTVTLVAGNSCGTDSAKINLLTMGVPSSGVASAGGTSSGSFSGSGTVTESRASSGHLTIEGCSPLTFFRTSDDYHPLYDYKWSIDGKAVAHSDTLPPQTLTNANSTATDTHEVVLNVDNICGSHADTMTVIVHPETKAVFEVDKDTICLGESILLTNGSFGEALAYEWDFGVGALVEGDTLTYSTSGTYEVQLIAKGRCKADTATVAVVVIDRPNANYTAVLGDVCARDSIAFANTSTGADTYQWDFGDGSTSTQENPSHAFTTPGDGTVQLVAMLHSSGCADTLRSPVRITPSPTAGFSAPTVCHAASTSFTDASVGDVVSWEWHFGDGPTAVSNAQHPTYAYGKSGTYNTTLKVTNTEGCTHTLSREVEVTATPKAGFSATASCLGGTMDFTDTTKGTPTSWEWRFGDGSAVAASANPAHVYTSAGTFTVQLIAKSGDGCADTVQQTVEVHPIPTSDFTTVENCIRDSTLFSDASLGSPDTYVWDFGDGSTDAADRPNPRHVYTASGTFDVTLTTGYSATGCTHSKTLTVNALSRTSPGFSASTACLGGATVFTDTTKGSPISWEWDFGDGSTDNTQHPSHTYAARADYPVRLVTKNAFGCADTAVVNVAILSLPVAEFAWDTVCRNAATTFADQSTSAASWEWRFGDASLPNTTASPEHTYPADGRYTVRLVVTNEQGCADTSEHEVIVRPNPVSDYSATTVCHTFPTSFTDRSVNAVGWKWDFRDGAPPNTTPSPSHIYPEHGAYAVELVVENEFGCTDTSEKTVEVLVQPQAGFTNTAVCAREHVAFTDTSTFSPTTWEWDFGDGTARHYAQHPAHTYALGGTYDVRLTVAHPSGCADTTTVPIAVYTVPTPHFTADTVCLLTPTPFADASTDAVPLSKWEWDFGDGNTSTDQRPVYIYHTPGEHPVQLTVTNTDGCDSSVTLPIFVSSTPREDFTADTVCSGMPTSFNDVSTGGLGSWRWDFGDGNKDTVEASPRHTYTKQGIYLVSLIVKDEEGCADQVFKAVEVRDNLKVGITAADALCDGQEFLFADNSVLEGERLGNTYHWDFGDGTSDNAQNSRHRYGAAGTYTVTHTVETAKGCKGTTTVDVAVMDVPEVRFQVAETCQNAATAFANESVIAHGKKVTYTWDFGDGSSLSTIAHPTHIYPVDGNFKVTLTGTSDFGCTQSFDRFIAVHPTPVTRFAFSPISCPDNKVQYTDLSLPISGDIVAWHWDFGDGQKKDDQHPAHQFSTREHRFDVTLVTVSDEGCTDTMVQSVETYPYPSFNYGPEQASECAEVPIQFFDSTAVEGGTITAKEWHFDDGYASFSNTPVHPFNSQGDYTIALQVTTSDGCVFADTLAYPLTIYPLPQSSFHVDEQQVSIHEAEIDFTDRSVDAMRWEWDFGDGYYSNEMSPTHEYLDTGQFEVMQIVHSDFGCVDTAVLIIAVQGEYAIYAPNTFTPKGAKNNTFRLYGMAVDQFFITVFDRYGNPIWQADDMEASWDGTHKGVVVADGVYVWRAWIVDTNGDERESSGFITVLN